MNRQMVAKAQKKSSKQLAGGVLQRKCDKCREEEKIFQRSAVGSAPETVPSIVHEVLRSPGQPLDASTRAFMELRFDHEFSRVPAQSVVLQASAPGLRIGTANDSYEQEADRVANRIMRATQVDVSNDMKSAAKIDFRRVRLHTDSRASESALAMNALAYASGENIVLGAGLYDPATIAGRGLLAHELTHVIQQDGRAFISPVIQLKSNDTKKKGRENPTRALDQAEIYRVLTAIYKTLAYGKVPAQIPERFREAVLLLSDAREDRTAQRKDKFERAMKKLRPVLDAATPGKYLDQIDSLVANWSMICSAGPALLPTPQLHQPFEHIYVAQGGEMVRQVAQKFGYEDPSPMCHPAYGYAPNMRLRAGDMLHIPYHPKLLNQMAVSSSALMKGALRYLMEFKEKQHVEVEKMENFLLIIDGISIMLHFGIGLGMGAFEGGEKMGTLIAKELAKTGPEIASMVADITKRPTKGLKFWIRHIVGPFTPSYWASLYVAIVKDEPDAYLFGPEGVAHARLAELANRTEIYCYSLKIKMESMIGQMLSPIYRYKY